MIIDFKQLNDDIKIMEIIMSLRETQNDLKGNIDYLKRVLNYMKFLQQLEQERENSKSSSDKSVRDIVREEIIDILKRGN